MAVIADFCSFSSPQAIPPNAGSHDTHARPLDPFSGAGHDNLRASVGSTEQDFREVILDGDCRTDRRYLEIRASSYAERAQLNWGSEVTVCLRSLTLTTPCARAPRRYAEAKNFPIGIARSWSWAIGSSTSAARRSFDVVVSRR
jgi:hypothetical protein